MKHTVFQIGALAVGAAGCACLLGYLARSARAKRRAAYEKQALLPVIAAGISENAPIFDGLYESLFQAAHDVSRFSSEAYEEWCDRVEQLDDDAFCGAFARLFCKQDIAEEALCRKNMQTLLLCIELAEIHRERESGASYPADAMLRRAYLTMDASRVEPDSTYTVIKSAWVCGDRVIEYGMLLPAGTNLAEGGYQA